MSGMMSQEVWMFDAGKFVNELYQNICNLTVYLIYISEYKQTLVRFHLHSKEGDHYVILLVLFSFIFAVNWKD